MVYKIVADSSANIMELKGVAFESVPMHVIVGEQDFIDDMDADVDAMLRALSAYKGRTSTSCPSPEDWMRAFGDADVVFCLTITSKLSGAYNSAFAAKQMYESEYPNRVVYVMDTMTTGPEMQLIAEQLQLLIKTSLHHTQIDQAIRQYAKRTHLYFSLASLDNFAKNGRINPLIAKGIGVLGLRIIGRAEEGELHPLGKARGDKKAIPALVGFMKEEGYTSGKVVIAHSGNPAGALELKKQIKAAFGTFNGSICENKILCRYYAEPQSILLGFEA